MREINLTYQPEKNLFFSKSDVEKVCKPQKIVLGYFTFGMIEPGRNVNPTDYNYSFQGMQKDNDVAGSGNSYTTYFRQYDPRLGRWKTTDPVIHAWEGPYVGFGNNPINNIDPHGNSFICAAYAVGQAIAAAAPYIAAVGATVGAEAASVAPHFSNNTNYLEGNDPGGSERKNETPDAKTGTEIGSDGIFTVIAHPNPQTFSNDNTAVNKVSVPLDKPKKLFKDFKYFPTEKVRYATILEQFFKLYDKDLDIDLFDWLDNYGIDPQQNDPNKVREKLPTDINIKVSSNKTVQNRKKELMLKVKSIHFRANSQNKFQETDMSENDTSKYLPPLRADPKISKILSVEPIK